MLDNEFGIKCYYRFVTELCRYFNHTLPIIRLYIDLNVIYLYSRWGRTFLYSQTSYGEERLQRT